MEIEFSQARISWLEETKLFPVKKGWFIQKQCFIKSFERTLGHMFMEVCFRHWIIKKGHCNFLSHKLTFFSELSDINSQWHIIKEKWDRNLLFWLFSHRWYKLQVDQLRVYISQFWLINCNDGAKLQLWEKRHNCSLYHKYQKFIIVKKKSELW